MSNSQQEPMQRNTAAVNEWRAIVFQTSLCRPNTFSESVGWVRCSDVFLKGMKFSAQKSLKVNLSRHNSKKSKEIRSVHEQLEYNNNNNNNSNNNNNNNKKFTYMYTGSLTMWPQSIYLTCTNTVPHAIPALGTIT